MKLSTMKQEYNIIANFVYLLLDLSKFVRAAINRTKDGQQILGDIQAYYIERSIQAATKGGLAPFNEFSFLKSLPQKESFNIIFQDPLAKKQISDLATFVGRTFRHGSKRGGSPTAQRLEASKESSYESEKSLIEAGKSAIKGDYWSGAKSAVNWIKGLGSGGLKDKNMAKALIDPEVREQILRDISSQHP